MVGTGSLLSAKEDTLLVPKTYIRSTYKVIADLYQVIYEASHLDSTHFNSINLGLTIIDSLMKLMFSLACKYSLPLYSILYLYIFKD